VVNYRSVILHFAVAQEVLAEQFAEVLAEFRMASSESEGWRAPARSVLGAWSSPESAAPGGWNWYLEVKSVAVPARHPTILALRKARQKFFSLKSLLHIWMPDDVAREKATVQNGPWLKK
jgi:hypothetical protein